MYVSRVIKFCEDNNIAREKGTTVFIQKRHDMLTSAKVRFHGLSGNEHSLQAFLALHHRDAFKADIVGFGNTWKNVEDTIYLFPVAKNVYEVIELRDSWFAFFPTYEHYPPFLHNFRPMTRDGRRDVRATWCVLYKCLCLQRDPSGASCVGHSPLIDPTSTAFNRVAYEHVHDRLLKGRKYCIHGLDITYKDFSLPPTDWFASIGKYYDPVTSEQAVDHDGRLLTIDDPHLKGNEKKGIKGHPDYGKPRLLSNIGPVVWQKEMMPMLRQCLPRPIGDGQIWPWFRGLSSTGKTSATRIMNRYYRREHQAVVQGDFGLGNITKQHRIIIFEDFRPGEVIKKAQHFMRAMDKGAIHAEIKRKQPGHADNNCVVIGNSNPLPVWPKDPSQATLTRLRIFEMYKVHKRNPTLSLLIDKYWYRVVHFLASEGYIYDERAGGPITPKNAQSIYSAYKPEELTH